jgi:hypothetical protein
MALVNVSGGCHCGDVSYTATVNDEEIIACHCSDCQLMSAAPFRAIAAVTKDNFQLNGNLTKYIKTAASGNPRVQAFCPNCGTHIYASSADEQPASYNLRVGTSEQRAMLKPSIEKWCDSMIPWLDNLNNTKKMNRQ